jgi:hypothetical protein
MEDLALFNFRALKGVAIFPHSVILSLFLKIHHIANPAKSNNLQTSIWLSCASLCLMTSSITADKLSCIFTETFLMHVFSLFWHIINNYGQNNTKKVTSLCIKHPRWDATYTTMYHTKQKTKLWLCTLVIYCGFFLERHGHPTTQQAASKAACTY